MRNYFLIFLLVAGACGDDAAMTTTNNTTGGTMATASGGTMAAAGGTMAAGDGDGDGDGDGAGDDTTDAARFLTECFEEGEPTEQPLLEDDGDSDCPDPLTREDFGNYCSTVETDYTVTYDFDACVQTSIAGGCQIDGWSDFDQLTVTFEDDTRCVWGAAR